MHRRFQNVTVVVKNLNILNISRVYGIEIRNQGPRIDFKSGGATRLCRVHTRRGPVFGAIFLCFLAAAPSYREVFNWR